MCLKLPWSEQRRVGDEGRGRGRAGERKSPHSFQPACRFLPPATKRLRQTIASRRRSRSYRGVLTAFRTHSLDRMREFHVKERGGGKTFLQEKIRSSTEWLLLFNPRSSTSIGFIQPEGDLMSKFLFFSFFFEGSFINHREKIDFLSRCRCTSHSNVRSLDVTLQCRWMLLLQKNIIIFTFFFFFCCEIFFNCDTTWISLDKEVKNPQKKISRKGYC